MEFWIQKAWKTMKSLYIYRKERRLLGEEFDSSLFNKLLDKYLNTHFKQDWIGRWYGIVNPDINIKGKFDLSSVVIEFDNTDTHNDMYVKNWLYKQLSMVKDLYHFDGLYDYINVEIEHVGPSNHDNYLIVFSFASQNYFRECLKSLMKRTILIMTTMIPLGIILYKFI